MELNERQRQILNIINTEQFATVEMLCGRIFASPATIRRDLSVLEGKKAIKRTWGGAMPVVGSNQEIPHDIRLYRNSVQKMAIAETALRFISNSSTIMLDSSTTCAYLAQRLGTFSDLSVFTNGLDALSVLTHLPSVKTIIAGGTVTKGYEMRGSLTMRSVESYNADLLFLSCCSVSTQSGVTFTDEDNASIKQRMAQHAEKRILLCDSSKFDQSSFYKAFSLRDFDYIVCDTAPQNEELRRQMGDRLICSDGSHNK